LKEEIFDLVDMFNIFIGQIPIELTRLAQLERVNLAEEPSLLTGFIERRIGFHFHILEKLGEFPLVEGSFRNLIEIYLPDEISSLDDEIFIY